MYVFQVKSRFFIFELVKYCSRIVLDMREKAQPSMVQSKKKLQVKNQKNIFL